MPVENQGCRMGPWPLREERGGSSAPFSLDLQSDGSKDFHRAEKPQGGLLSLMYLLGKWGSGRCGAEGFVFCSEAWTVKGMAVLSPEAALTQARKDLELLYSCSS